MSELRKDIVTREWVIIAPGRAERGQHFTAQPTESDDSLCPFCPGREAMEPELWAWRQPGSPANSPQWQVRVIPNKFPALEPIGNAARHDYHIYDCMAGVGAHEIVVETPHHNRNLVTEKPEQVAHVLEAYQARYRELCKDSRVEHVSIFKNHGWAAGATIRHEHSQIVATPVIPQLVWNNKQGQTQYREYRDTCVYCEIINTELSLNERVIAKNDDFVGLSPFAAHYPFEVWIVPRRHTASFANITTGERLALAQILHLLLTRLAEELDDPPYNYTLVSAPCKQDQDPLFHWHMEIIPRLSVIAGFELESNIFINTVTPEEARRRLRVPAESPAQHLQAT